MEKIFAGFQPRIFNQRFSAGADGTITCFARNSLGIEAAQIEINANYRIVESKSTGFKADPRNILDLVERLRRVITAIDEKITEDQRYLLAVSGRLADVEIKHFIG